ncbi:MULTISPECIES: polynucleotide adenylyltransferase PcnB [unclassified Uliginosibacterium]|uniref:polynucleotide adenylyltransferase PcnB n=1 Tax=unclassified Uliginosibacterium TaxID=2621521 RepID=UPI000C7BFC37|nr:MULTISPECIES: polynucleotide adenylyltransferase PcnB [unclassified Uliginosibacterium]MDO6388352.1 polynucleotide adenylyltransferase PcnB [Uliginosibacterium sp. 31-12]PLK47259.1 polynucleotide adenylyltransferase PcnB [Uliginosibacterium sp. TH139]
MIRKLLRRVFKKAPASLPVAEAAAIPLELHGIRREMVSPASRKVCHVLQEAGFKAYVVGGAVRDLIARIDPKDFDVATNATPEEVRHLFRRSRIIGRRFRIVHVMSGPETIEVSTFRALHDEDTVTDEHGRVLHDNTWGTIEADATRRDFTVNALYYDPTTETVLDFHHGVADLKQKTMRVIGDPATRYREDPVRMLRAVRLAAKLDLALDPDARKPIREMSELLANVPAARLFDEMLKLLSSGYAVVSLKRLRDEGLHHGLLPLLDVILEQPQGEKFVWLALENTDERVRAGKPISPGFLFATLLWNEVLSNWSARKERGEYPQPALFEAMDEVLASQAEKLAITRRIAGDITEIWALQPRFEKRAGKAPFRLIEQPRFRAAYDFLRLRAESGEIEMALPDWWDDFANANTDDRETMLVADKKGDGAARKRRPRRRKPRSETGGAEPAGE